jgi:membrane-bound metal-dependent hydrolase YbcI (DUF457 family)
MGRRRVSVDAERFRTGELPPVCVVSGRSADRVVRVRFTHTPDWPWLLLPFGVLPALIALMFTSQRLDGALPLHQRAIDDHRRRRRLVVALLVLSLVLLLGAALTTESALAVAGVVGLVLAIVAKLVTDLRFVRAVPRDGGRQVMLRRVHPDFAAAVTVDGARRD